MAHSGKSRISPRWSRQPSGGPTYNFAKFRSTTGSCTSHLSDLKVYNIRIPLNLSFQMSSPKYNFPRWKSTCHLNHSKISKLTRMHSSRMYTVRHSGRLIGGLPGEGVSGQEAVWPGGCLHRGVWLEGCLPRGVCTFHPEERILDTRLWKHYLSATLFADSNNEWKNIAIFQIFF